MSEKGKFLIFTGDGKGKSTAAFGLALRACGWGKKVLIIQFIKSPDRPYGESIMFEKLGVEMHQTGIGFTWLKTPEEHREALKEAWDLTKEKIKSLHYDVVILDELNNALAIERFEVDDIIPLDEVIALVNEHRDRMDIVVTGRSAKQELIDIADLVTEMKVVKHYYDEGTTAIKGLEY